MPSPITIDEMILVGGGSVLKTVWLAVSSALSCHVTCRSGP